MGLVEWSALVGSLMPSVVAVINQPSWPSWLRAVATAVVCIVAGVLTAASTGGLSGASLTQAIGVVFGAALATYHAWWKRSGITDAIEKHTALS